MIDLRDYAKEYWAGNLTAAARILGLRKKWQVSEAERLRLIRLLAASEGKRFRSNTA